MYAVSMAFLGPQYEYWGSTTQWLFLLNGMAFQTLTRANWSMYSSTSPMLFYLPDISTVH